MGWAAIPAKSDSPSLVPRINRLLVTYCFTDVKAEIGVCLQMHLIRSYVRMLANRMPMLFRITTSFAREWHRKKGASVQRAPGVWTFAGESGAAIPGCRRLFRRR